MNREIAGKIKTHALVSIENLSSILLVEGVSEDSSIYKKLHREVGILIGETHVQIVEWMDRLYPELDDTP